MIRYPHIVSVTACILEDVILVERDPGAGWQVHGMTVNEQ